MLIGTIILTLAIVAIKILDWHYDIPSGFKARTPKQILQDLELNDMCRTWYNDD